MPKVYVIDDSLSVCMAVERMLSAHGIEVIAEKSGLNAVVNLQKEAPDLVICDVILPDIEGFRICAFIKQNTQLSKIPVLMISGIVDDEVQEQAKKVGAECILKKPFAADELIGTVQKFISTQPESPAAAPPQPDMERLRALFDQLAGLRHFHFVGIADADGKFLESAGVPATAQEDLSQVVTSLLHQADLLTTRSMHGKLEGVIIEETAGLLLARPLTDQYAIILALEDASALGKARLVLRRLHKPLADALYDRPPEASAATAPFTSPPRSSISVNRA